MVAAPQPDGDRDAVPAARLRRFTGEEYDKLVALGYFAGEKVELLRGLIVTMSPSEPPHAWAIQRLIRLLVSALGDRADIRPQSTFKALHSRPEPDLVIVPVADYSRAHPSSAHLIIEISESSLRYDQHDKAALYAEASVRDYWIVNLVDGCIEVRREPTPQGYRTTTTYRRGERAALLDFPDVTIAVDDVLPPPR